jgi:hypothetical protein
VKNLSKLKEFQFEHFNLECNMTIVPLSHYVGSAQHSITRNLHAHSFYSHVILHTVHPSVLRVTSATYVSIQTTFTIIPTLESRKNLGLVGIELL